MIVANATGCSSIYGANLPTTPWTTNAEGRGPAWNNSLFEDNAEFGLGMRLGARRPAPARPRRCWRGCAASVGDELARAILDNPQDDRAADRRAAAPRSPSSRDRLAAIAGGRTPPTPRHLARRRRATWCARACGSSAATAGPTTSASAASTTCCRRAATSTSSCSTPRCTPTPAARRRRRRPRGAVAKFAAAGKGTGKKDLGAIARAYGNVYVAQISMGANELQTTKALARGRRLAGPVAGHRLQHLHRPRHRHVEVDEPPEGRGEERLLAAVPLPAQRGRRRPAVQARLPDSRRSRCATSSPPRPASPSSSAPTPSGPPSSPRCCRPTSTSAGATTSSSPAMHRTVPHVTTVADDVEPEVENDAGYRYDERGPG